MFDHSIRKRLTFTLLVILSLFGILTILLSYNDGTHEVNELFDAQLAQSARIIQAEILSELDEGGAEELLDFIQQHKKTNITLIKNEGIHEHGHRYESKIGFQIWDSRGRIVLHSSSLGNTPLSRESLNPKNAGFTDVVYENEKWRIFSLWDARSRFVIITGEQNHIRSELVTKIGSRLIAPYLISLPLLAAMIWYGIGRGLQPLRQVVTEIKSRESQNLSAIDTKQIPEEIRPLVFSLNDLFARLEIAFHKERQFTNDAAHELRTPLAALKTHVQVALREKNNPATQTALVDILAGVERANHLVQQLLTLARLAPERSTLPFQLTPLYPIAEMVSAELIHRADARNIELTLSGDTQVSINTEHTILMVLLRNLLDNAIKYTPRGGRVAIEIGKEAHTAFLRITDTGPGISETLKERVFDRFYRVLGTDVEGCGLGLTIVKQCADVLHAKLQLENIKPTGLCVTVRFAQNDQPGAAV